MQLRAILIAICLASLAPLTGGALAAEPAIEAPLSLSSTDELIAKATDTCQEKDLVYFSVLGADVLSDEENPCCQCGSQDGTGKGCQAYKAPCHCWVDATDKCHCIGGQTSTTRDIVDGDILVPTEW